MLTRKRARGLSVSAVITAWLLITAVAANAADPGKNGKIAFVSFIGSQQIYTINPDGTDLFRVTNMPPSDDIFAFWPDFSPDGKRILFSHDMTGSLELYVINADGSGLTQITHDGLPHVTPHWSPDGSHITFSTTTELGPLVIATVRADGSERKLLTSPVWDSLVAEYTPDGKHMVFQSSMDGLVSALWIMDTDGNHKRRLTDPELEAGPLDISPDGECLVTNSNQNTPKPSSIFKVSLHGGGVTRLTSGHNDGFAVYSPDGKKILFVTDRNTDGLFETWVMNADGSGQRLLLEGSGEENWGVRP
jgi:Tol biopolymer transport system component